MATRVQIWRTSVSTWLEMKTVLPAAASAAHQVAHLDDARRIEAVGWLVQHQQVGVLQQRHRHAQTLLHAERVGLDAVLVATLQPTSSSTSSMRVSGTPPSTEPTARRLSRPDI